MIITLDVPQSPKHRIPDAGKVKPLPKRPQLCRWMKISNFISRIPPPNRCHLPAAQNHIAKRKTPENQGFKWSQRDTSRTCNRVFERISRLYRQVFPVAGSSRKGDLDEPVKLISLDRRDDLAVTHVRKRSFQRSVRFPGLQATRHPLYREVIRVEDAARIAVVSDIHHNTLMYSKALETFGKMGVNVIFLLGDYSYLPERLNGTDPSDLRYRQFREVMKLTRAYQLKHSATVICLMGNHEIEPWYFGPSSASQLQMRAMIRQMRSWGFLMPSNPFSGFELDDSFRVTVFSEMARLSEDLDTVRTFLLTHAISSPLVNAMYRGFPDDPVKKKSMRAEISDALGELWGEHIDYGANKAKPLWALTE